MSTRSEGSSPTFIPGRTWPSCHTSAGTRLDVVETAPEDDTVVLSVACPASGERLFAHLDVGATGELVSDLLRRLALMAGRRAAMEAAADASIAAMSGPEGPLVAWVEAAADETIGGAEGSDVQRLPHILTLTRTEEYDPDCPDWWDDAELACPFPPSPLNPCTVWRECGCRPNPAEMHGEWETGSGPCPRSATGEHHYWEGEPQMPDPAGECWPVHHADFYAVKEAATELALSPGRYTVQPWPDYGALRLDLMAWVEP